MMTNQIPVAGSAREASFTKRTKFDDKHESEHVDGVHGVLRGLLGEDDEDYIMMMMAVMIRLLSIYCIFRCGRVVETNRTINSFKFHFAVVPRTVTETQRDVPQLGWDALHS